MNSLRGHSATATVFALATTLMACVARAPTVADASKRTETISLPELRRSNDGYARRYADRVEAAWTQARGAIPRPARGATTAEQACLLASSAEIDAILNELRAHPETAQRGVMAAVHAELGVQECSRPEYQKAFGPWTSNDATRTLNVLGAVRAAYRLHAPDASSLASELVRLRPNEALAAYWHASVDSNARSADRLRGAASQFEQLGAWAYAARATDLLGNEGSLEDQVEASDRALELARAHLDPDHPVLIELWHSRAASHIWRADYASGMPFLTKALDLSRRTLGERHLVTADLQVAWLAAELNLGEPRLLIERTPDLRAGIEPLLGEGHPTVLTCRTNAVMALFQLKELVPAEAEGRAILELSRQVMGEKSEETAGALMFLGSLAFQRENFEEAAGYIRQSTEITDAVFEVGHAHRYQGYIMLAMAQVRLGRYDDARESIADARTRLHEAHGVDHKHERTIDAIEAAVEREDPRSTKFASGIPPATIQRVFRVNTNRFRHCYDEGMDRDPKLRGKVVVRFEIDGAGRVGAAADGGSNMPDRKVTACVLHVTETLVFPKHGGEAVKVVYPFDFTPN